MIKKYNQHSELDGLKKKLAAYSALAGAFIAVAPSESDAAIVYTDINPDAILVTTSQVYAIDLDNNGTPDFNINFAVNSYGSGTYQYQIQGAALQMLGNNQVMGSSYSYVSVLNNGNAINASQNWISSSFSYGVLGVVINSMYSGYSYNYAYGNWLGQTDKYLGVRFDIGGQTHYGWVRLDMKTDGSSVKIKDYAYEDVANTAINAGDTGSPLMPADTAMSIIANDVADSGNSTDLEISFDKAIDESTISEYRIIVVKSADASTFDLNAANAVSLANLTSVTPNGSNIVQVMPINSKDKDGDLITFNVPYKAFVHSIPDGTNANANSLSSESNEVSLNMPLIPADMASNVMAADIADNGNGKDLEVSFDKAPNETTISEYRIIIVKSADAATFTLNDANAVTPSNSTSYSPQGVNIVHVFDNNATDKDGDAVTTNVPYKAFVLAIANGSSAFVNSLSSESNEVTLNVPIISADPASNIMAADIANNGNGLDLEITFDKAADETKVGEYRIITVKSADASTFDLTAADLVTDYNSVLPNGNNVSQVLNAASKDKNGDNITTGTPYKAFVLSVADGVNANVNILSAESNEVILDNMTSIDAPEFQNGKISVFAHEDKIRFSFPDGLNSIQNVTVVSITGQLIKSASRIGINESITLDNASEGIYIVQYWIDDQVFMDKVHISGKDH